MYNFLNASQKESLKPVLKEMSHMMPIIIQVLFYGIFWAFRAQMTLVIFIFLITMTHLVKVTKLD